MGWKSRMGRGRLAINQSKPPGEAERVACVSQDRVGMGDTRTFPCARRECTRVDEEVLAIIEQAHSCRRARGRLRGSFVPSQ
jgi:hypothetical protein